MPFSVANVFINWILMEFWWLISTPSTTLNTLYSSVQYTEIDENNLQKVIKVIADIGTLVNSQRNDIENYQLPATWRTLLIYWRIMGHKNLFWNGIENIWFEFFLQTSRYHFCWFTKTLSHNRLNSLTIMSTSKNVNAFPNHVWSGWPNQKLDWFWWHSTR